jgi:excisionase family DNA binding protein
MSQEQAYMTTGEVAELVRAPAETVRYWRHVGRGPRSFKIGRKVLYARSDVERWIADAREAQPA